MSRDIFVKVMRAGVQVAGATNVYVQLDNMSQQESAFYGGAAPYQRFQAYTLVTLDMRQSDLLIDLNNIDPKTNTNTQYRVINIPEFYPDGHGEIVCDLMRGT
jgi:hypothetical protein